MINDLPTPLHWISCRHNFAPLLVPLDINFIINIIIVFVIIIIIITCIIIIFILLLIIIITITKNVKC